MISENKSKSSITASSLSDTAEYTDRSLEFGKYLQSKREAKQLSVRKLAKKARISYSELSRIEHGKQVTPSTLRKLAPYLSVPYDVLLDKAGFSYRKDTSDPLYLDLNGSPTNLEQEALKLYSIDVELFFTLSTFIDNCNLDDSQHIKTYIEICRKKKHLSTQKKLNSNEKMFLNLTNSLQTLIDVCSAM